MFEYSSVNLMSDLFAIILVPGLKSLTNALQGRASALPDQQHYQYVPSILIYY